MALKVILDKQTDFTGEFPQEWAKSGLWRFNEAAPDSNTSLIDSSGCNRKMLISGWSGTTADLRGGPRGNYIRINMNSPTTEKTYLKVENDGSIFSNLGKHIIVGGWMNPTTYSIDNTYTPIFNTRYGPGQPIFYVSLINGRPRISLYNSVGALILDSSVKPPFSFVAGSWYFLACMIDLTAKTAQFVVGDQSTKECWTSENLSFTGELNRSCTADVIMGMHANSYWYSGFLDDWFLDCDSELVTDDLVGYFQKSICANGGDTSGTVDALSEPGFVKLRASTDGYPAEGVLLTTPVECMLFEAGKVSVTSECISGVTAISAVEVSTSDDLQHWSDWSAVESNGKITAQSRSYIRFRITLTTTDKTKTPKITSIRLYDAPKQPYEKLGYARPVILDSNRGWEAVLENAYDVVVTGEINGEDTLSFKLPFKDGKRKYVDSEKKVQIVNDIYIIRKITDVRSGNGDIETEVYAEAEFYDLAVAVLKEEKAFDAVSPEVPMAYALKDTEWSVGTV